MTDSTTQQSPSSNNSTSPTTTQTRTSQSLNQTNTPRYNAVNNSAVDQQNRRSSNDQPSMPVQQSVQVPTAGYYNWFRQ